MTTYQDDKIAELSASGMLQCDIAKTLNLHRNTVSKRQQIMGIIPTVDGPEFTDKVLSLREQGVSQREAARLLGRSQQVIRIHEEILHNQGRRDRGTRHHGEEVIDEVLRRSLEGQTPHEIAREMGMRAHAIWKIRTRLRDEGFDIRVIAKRDPSLTPIDWSKHPRYEDVTFKVR